MQQIYEILQTQLLFISIIAIICFALFFPTYQEVKTFNRCTNSNISMIDGLFGQFRVEHCKK